MCTHPAALLLTASKAFESGESRHGNLALAKLVGPLSKLHLLVRVSLRHYCLRNSCFISRGGRHSARCVVASGPIPIAASGYSASPRLLYLPGSGRSARDSADFYWHAQSP